MDASTPTIEVIPERPVACREAQSELDITFEVRAGRSSANGAPTRRSINLCIVLDRSGSMRGAKLESAKAAALGIYQSITDSDAFTLLAFDDIVAQIVSPRTPRAEAIERLEALTVGGQTNLSKAWYTGLLELQTYALGENSLNRLLLISDGQANSGEQRQSVLGAESRRAREELDISTSTIGVGADFQEDILSCLSQESGGTFWFIDEASIDEIIRSEFEGALSVTVDRPRVEISYPAGVRLMTELNDLTKVAGRYRIRPIKTGESIGFSQRLEIDFDTVKDPIVITANLFDGEHRLGGSSTTIEIVDIDHFLSISPDSRVAASVNKFQSARSDEEIIRAMDEGSVADVVTMLESQSNMLQELQSKLEGVSTISWDDLNAREREEAERQRQALEDELAELQESLNENSALVAVGALVDLMRRAGLQARAADLLRHARKMGKMREMRNREQRSRSGSGGFDDRAVRRLLEDSLHEASALASSQLVDDTELDRITRSLREQLEFFA